MLGRYMQISTYDLPVLVVLSTRSHYKRQIGCVSHVKKKKGASNGKRNAGYERSLGEKHKKKMEMKRQLRIDML